MDGSAPAAPLRDLPTNMAERLIVALDLPKVDDARLMAERLDGVVSFFKIGMWLFCAPGADRLIDDLVAKGKNVFLDYKMYDIGETVKEGVARVRERGVKFVTIHGDPRIMQAAVEGKGGDTRLKLMAVTVLTSLNDADLKEMGYSHTAQELVELRVRQAAQYGVDGVIASGADDPNEMRRRAAAPGLLVTTPGVRRQGGGVDDHRRPATPAETIARGADYIVVGRPIIRAADPAAEALAIVEDMKRGAAGGEIK